VLAASQSNGFQVTLKHLFYSAVIWFGVTRRNISLSIVLMWPTVNIYSFLFLAEIYLF